MPNSVGDIYEVVYIQRLHGQILNTVRHYAIKTVAPGAVNTPVTDVEVALLDRVTDTATQMKTVLCQEWSLIGIKAQRVWPLPRSAGVITTAENGPGANAPDSLPSTCCAVIRFRTEFAGVRFRGRAFIGGLPKTVEVDSKITEAYRTQLTALGFSMIQNNDLSAAAAPVDIVMDGVLYNRTSRTTTDIINVDVDDVIRVQRRREVGKGV